MMIALSLMSMMEYLVAGNYLMNTLFLCGGSSGCVWAAYNQYANSHSLSGNILLLFPDGGYPYLDTIYNAENGLKIHMGEQYNTIN